MAKNNFTTIKPRCDGLFVSFILCYDYDLSHLLSLYMPKGESQNGDP